MPDHLPLAARPLRRRRLLLAAALTSGAGLLSTGGPAAARPAARGYALPAPTGAGQLGTVALHLVDNRRTDPFVPSHPVREIMVQIWYPARRTRSHPPAPWLSPGAVPHFAGVLGFPADTVRATTTHARIGAPVDRRAGRRPVVLYSPGFGAHRGTGTALVEDLAAHGYIVVTIDHTHDAGEVEFPDGRVEVAGVPDELDDRYIGTAAAVRKADSRFVLDQLAAIDAGHNPDAGDRPLPDGLRGAFDLHRIGMFGHSLGGSTAADTMHDDPRVTAGVNMDGSFVGTGAVAGSDRPFLLFSSDHGADYDPSWNTFWANQRGWRREVSLLGTTHGSFNDGQVLYPQAARELGLTAGQLAEMVGTLGAARSVAIQRTCLRAFFDLHLRGRDSRLFRAPHPRYPELRLVR